MRKYKPIRVTTVLSFVESAWKEFWWRSIGFEAADKISKESSEFGTRVHVLVGKLLMGGSVDALDITPETKCAVAIIQYLHKEEIMPCDSIWENSLEIQVEDKKLGLIGHFDALAVVEGRHCIIDFKTSNKMRSSFPLQKAAYAYMANKQMGLNINRGLTIRSHWNKEKQEVEFETKYYDNLVKKYWPKFKACLAIYKYFTRKEK